MLRSREEALRVVGTASSWWCCINGEVVETTEAECGAGRRYYGSREEALRVVRPAAFLSVVRKPCRNACSRVPRIVSFTSVADCRGAAGEC